MQTCNYIVYTQTCPQGYVWLKTQSSLYMYCKSKSWTSSRLIMSYEKSHKNTDENINWKKNSNIAWSQSLQWSDNHRFINQLKGNKKHFIINYAHYSWVSATYDIFLRSMWELPPLGIASETSYLQAYWGIAVKETMHESLDNLLDKFQIKEPSNILLLW